jgi:hypothetical protein
MSRINVNKNAFGRLLAASACGRRKQKQTSRRHHQYDLRQGDSAGKSLQFLRRAGMTQIAAGDFGESHSILLVNRLG